MLLWRLENATAKELIFRSLHDFLRFLVDKLRSIDRFNELVALQSITRLLLLWLSQSIDSKFSVAILLLCSKHGSSFHELFSFGLILLAVKCLAKSHLSVDRVLCDETFLHRKF